MIYNAARWYWTVGGDSSRVYSSESGAYVQPSDPAFSAWAHLGNLPTQIASEADLASVLTAQAPQCCGPGSTGLIAYAASACYAKETGGIAVFGVAMPTDRETQAQLSGAYAYAQATPSATIQWKLANGSFVNLTATQITAIATAVAAHVQACFAAEATAVAGIAAGSITTRAQVDAAFAAVTL